VGVKGDQEDMAAVAVETAISRPADTIQRFKATSKNVIPANAGIQNLFTSLDSRWSLPRTCRLDPTTGYGAGVTN